MKMVDFIREDLILPDIRSRKKKDVIQELATHVGVQEGLDPDLVARMLLEREHLGSTALASGIAIPHAKLESIDRLVGCLGRSKKGVDFGSMDGTATHLFFVLIAPRNSTGDHLKALARVSRLFQKPSAQARLLAAGTAHEMYEIVLDEDGAGSQ